jgi:hypothetical protein
MYALKNVPKGQSEMNNIDCLRLKRNYAWWLFSGVNLTYANFKYDTTIHLPVHMNASAGLKTTGGCHRKNCSCNGLSKKETFKNYEKRMKDVKAVEAAATAAGCTAATKDILQNTSKFLAPMQTRKAATPNFVCWYSGCSLTNSIDMRSCSTIQYCSFCKKYVSNQV